MPTLRERTSTSSAPIVGTSSSRIAAFRGSSKTSAFIPVPSSLLDQDLDLVGGSRSQTSERVGRIVERYAARDHPLDRQAPGADLRRDTVEVVDPVAPSADDREIVERPEHRFHRRLADEKPGLRERPAPAQRAYRRGEAFRMARALDRDVDAEAVAL